MKAQSAMVTLRCTRKLLQRARLTPSSTPVVPTTRLGDWYATVVPFRSPLVLALSETTLLAVALPLAPATAAETHALNLRLADLIYSTTNYESPTDVTYRAFGLQVPLRRGLH